MSMKRFWKWQYIVPAAIVLVPAGIALFVTITGGLVMWLWNWLLPPLFGWPPITLLQGFGLLVLCRMLFGGFGGGGGQPPRKRGTGDDARGRMRERWACTPRGGDGNEIDATTVNSTEGTR